MSRRRPNADELALWRQVAETTRPMKRKARLRFPEKPAAERAETPSDTKLIAPFTVGELSNPGTAAPRAMETREPAVRMDRKAFGKLKRGKLKPEAKLDLHGMTLDRARGATTTFLLRAFGDGLRLVLIVTGKGKRSHDLDVIPERQGVLRHHLPHWLSAPPLAQMVLQVSEAHGRHGGDGAFYVYLRRQR